MRLDCRACRHRSIDGYCARGHNKGGARGCGELSPKFGLRLGDADPFSVLMHGKEKAPVLRFFINAGRIMKWTKALVIR